LLSGTAARECVVIAAERLFLRSPRARLFLGRRAAFSRQDGDFAHTL
jgi:hypothetical protein